jgi:GrpB-like predicted nucleotidyltransferase (UPF0157 family)
METVHFIKTGEISERVETLFTSDKHKLSSLFPDADIEHIGATSVPGSITKGDLDINVRVEPNDFQRAKEILAGLCQINQPDNWTSGFARGAQAFSRHRRQADGEPTADEIAGDCEATSRNSILQHPHADHR